MDWYSKKIYSHGLNKFNDNFDVIKLFSFESIISFINLELTLTYIKVLQHGNSKDHFSTVILFSLWFIIFRSTGGERSS